MKVLVTPLRPTLCNPMGCSSSGSPVHIIFQARILEWVDIPFSRGSSQARNQTRVSFIAKFVTICLNCYYAVNIVSHMDI